MIRYANVLLICMKPTVNGLNVNTVMVGPNVCVNTFMNR